MPTSCHGIRPLAYRQSTPTSCCVPYRVDTVYAYHPWQHIDEVIRNQPTVLPGEVQQLIRSMTGEFLSEFYNFLRERGIDVTTSKCVFAGGGSLLLRGMIERANKVAFPIFIEDIHANARGYELLYQSEVTSNGQ